MLIKVQPVAQRMPGIQSLHEIVLGIFDSGCLHQQSFASAWVYNHDTLMVGEDQITWVHRNPSASHGYLQLSELGRSAGKWGDEPAINGQLATLHLCDVPVSRIDHDSTQTSR